MAVGTMSVLSTMVPATGRLTERHSRTQQQQRHESVAAGMTMTLILRLNDSGWFGRIGSSTLSILEQNCTNDVNVQPVAVSVCSTASSTYNKKSGCRLHTQSHTALSRRLSRLLPGCLPFDFLCRFCSFHSTLLAPSLLGGRALTCCCPSLLCRRSDEGRSSSAERRRRRRRLDEPVRR